MPGISVTSSILSTTQTNLSNSLADYGTSLNTGGGVTSSYSTHTLAAGNDPLSGLSSGIGSLGIGSNVSSLTGRHTTAVTMPPLSQV